MMKLCMMVVLFCLSLFVQASDMPVMKHDEANGLIKSLGFDRLEWQKSAGEQDILSWDFSGWLGDGQKRAWIKTEGSATQENTGNAFVQLVYSQAFSAFWDWQLGLHSQQEPYQEDYLMLGVFGLAPYFVQMDSYFLLNDEGDGIWKLEADYDLKLSRQWVLLADAGLTANTRNNAKAMTGSGLSESVFAVRIAYEGIRKLVPYIGIEWEKALGKTADIRQALQYPASEWHGVLGVQIRY